MLLTSPGDNNSSLSTDSVQTQTSTAATQRGIEGDRSQSDHACLPASNDIYADAGAAENGASVSSNGEGLTLGSLQRQASRLPRAFAHEVELDGLYALRQAAGFYTRRKTRASSLSRGTLVKLATSNAIGYLDSSFAAPLSPLRARDIQALSDLFLRDDIYTIEADVSQRLLALLPEPYWEDDTFAFLQEFLR